MYVVGTAGHVDHGKSTLVKTLTGIDPDRWEEEQRREMTIDLGFAWLTLPSGKRVSLIDVPGHERFIKNMLAGVGGIDAALLVVAADESIMPQTDEHLAILDLLNIEHGVVALTKTDLVDDEWLALVTEDVRSRLQNTTLANAPLIPLSSRTGQGLDMLLGMLDTVLDRTPTRIEARGAARLPVDRAFTIGGFGAVVTGTLSDGPLRVGDEVEILPKGLQARVRGLQTHQQKQELALPGTRVAVNLAGVSHHDLARGDVLALPGRLQPTQLLDARLRLVDTLARPIRQNDRFDLFVGAAEVPCRITLLESDELLPGATAWVQFRLERPLAVARGDRYIVRQPSPSRTIGGGQIVEPHPARHRRFRSEVISELDALARGTPGDLVLRAINDGLPHIWGDVVRTSGLPEAVAAGGMHELRAAQQALVLQQAGQEPSEQSTILRHSWVITQAGWAALCLKAAQLLAGYHRRYPLRSGIPREELRSRLQLRNDAFDIVLAALDTGLIQIRENSVWLATHRPNPTAEQERSIRRMLSEQAAAPYSPPIPELEPELLAFLVEQGRLVRVAPDIAFLPEPYNTMVAWVRSQLETSGSITVAQFRDRFGSSRKYALALLEHLDERKITRRVGDTRILY